MLELIAAVRVLNEIENTGGFFCQFLITGKQTEVGINLRGFLVKVTGTEVRVIDQRSPFLTGYQTQLTVNF